MILFIYFFKYECLLMDGRDISVCIATRYGLDGPWRESRLGGNIFRIHPD